jgi:hypothetical protein
MRIVRSSTQAELLQWVGLFGAALTWTAQQVAGIGVTFAHCNPASGSFGLDATAIQIALMAAGVTFVLVAEAAEISVLLATSDVEDSVQPPWGRRRFFAVAAAIGNVLFLVMILLSGTGAIVFNGCRQG